MKKIYTVYQLNEKVNELGNPYIGFTENIKTRARVWKNKLKLNHIPELIVLYTNHNEIDAYNWEQDKRVVNGWGKEKNCLADIRKANLAASKSNKLKKHAKKVGKIAVTSGNLIKARVISVEKRTLFTKEQAKEIKNLYNSKDELGRRYSINYLSKKYNCQRVTIRNILNGKTKYYN
jgi:hypothetical protein